MSGQVTPVCECPKKESCCEKKPAVSPELMKVMVVLEKVSLVGLGIFACYTEPMLFLGFAGGGLLVGAFIYRKEAAHKKTESRPSCAQGFLESSAEVYLPPPTGLVINVAVTYCHIDHHSQIFVPIVAFILGIWVAKLAMRYLPMAYRKVCPLTPVAA